MIERRRVVEGVIEGMRIRPGHEAQWAFIRGALIGMEGVIINRGEGERVLERVREYGRGLEAKRGGLTEEEERDWMFLERYFKDSGKGGVNWYKVIQAHVTGLET